ncbi:MAG: LysR family transcriptional regulator [Bryobacteraceae bacterium]
MRFGELRSLVQLAESSSLRATATALHLSPSAIHKQLRTLQDELGLSLYCKAGGKLRLTEEGRLILPNARSLLVQHDRTIATVREWKGLQRGVLRVGSGPTIATYLLPALLKEFRLAHPKIDIVVETGSTRQLLNSIEDGTIQLALLVEPALDEEQRIKEHLSWEFEIVLVSSPQSATRSCSIRKLAAQTFVLFRVGARIQQAIDQYFRKHEFRPRIAMRFDNADAIKAMVRGGFGLSMLPFWAVAADLRRRELQLVRQTEAPLLSRIVLVSASDMHQPKAVDAFIDLAKRSGSARWDLRSQSSGKQRKTR